MIDDRQFCDLLSKRDVAIWQQFAVQLDDRLWAQYRRHYMSQLVAPFEDLLWDRLEQAVSPGTTVSHD